MDQIVGCDYVRRLHLMLNPQGLIQGDGWMFGRTAKGALAYDLATGDILYEGPDGSPQASPRLDLMAGTTSGR